MVDALLVEFRSGDWEIVDPGDEFDRTTVDAVRPLECVVSFDHSLRTAEDTAASVAAAAADLIVGPILAAVGLSADSWAAAVDYFGLAQSTYSGLWHCEDPDDAQWLYECVDYRYEPALADAGYRIETSADCGMTWIYREVS